MSKGFTISLFFSLFYFVQSPFSDTWVFYHSPSKPWQTLDKQQVCPWETTLEVSVLLIPESEEVMLSKGIVCRKLGWRKIEASLHDSCLHHLQIGENAKCFHYQMFKWQKIFQHPRTNNFTYNESAWQVFRHLYMPSPIPHPLLKRKWPKAVSCLCNTDNFYSEPYMLGGPCLVYTASSERLLYILLIIWLQSNHGADTKSSP